MPGCPGAFSRAVRSSISRSMASRCAISARISAFKESAADMFVNGPERNAKSAGNSREVI